MKKTQSALLFLAAVLAAAVTSCGGDTPASTPSDNKTPSGNEAQSGETETEEDLQKLFPETIDLEGRTMRVMNGYTFEKDAFMLVAETETGDVVNDAVYKRNLDVESSLNVTMQYENFYIGDKDAAEVIRKSVQAGEDNYDLVFGLQWNMVPLVLNNIFRNIAGAKYLDLDQPWWYQNYIRELSVGKDKTYFVTGDITLGVLRNMSCMYVNKDLYRQYYESVDDIYQEVLDGKWTLDLLAQRCSEMYQDLNGDGKIDESDRYGLGVITASLTDHFTYDAGVRATARDEDNIPYITMDSEHTVSFTQKLYDLFYSNSGVYVFPCNQESVDVTIPNKLNEGGLLYMPGWFYSSELLRDKEVDYAVIPFPKYDENQETYLSLAHDVATIVCIPTTASDVDNISAVMEAMAYCGYRDVLPAYYEVAIKVKYNRDSTDTAMQILDIIHDNSTTDFAYIYNYAMNGLGLIERELMGNKKPNFASYYTRIEKTSKKNLDKLITKFTEIDD